MTLFLTLNLTVSARRASEVLLLLKKEVELCKLQADIGKRVEEKISSDQRRYFLTEQLRSIKKELGLEKDDKSALVQKCASSSVAITAGHDQSAVHNKPVWRRRLRDCRSLSCADCKCCQAAMLAAPPHARGTDVPALDCGGRRLKRPIAPGILVSAA